MRTRKRRLFFLQNTIELSYWRDKISFHTQRRRRFVVYILRRRPNSVGVRWDFIRKCMKINTIHPKFHFFFDKKRNKNDSPCVFVLLFFAVSSPLEAVLSTFKIFSCTNNKKNGKAGALKPTVLVRSSINLIKRVQTRQNCRKKNFVNCNLFTRSTKEFIRTRWNVSVRSRSNWNLKVLVFKDRQRICW